MAPPTVDARDIKAAHGRLLEEMDLPAIAVYRKRRLHAIAHKIEQLAGGSSASPLGRAALPSPSKGQWGAANVHSTKTRKLAWGVLSALDPWTDLGSRTATPRTVAHPEVRAWSLAAADLINKFAFLSCARPRSAASPNRDPLISPVDGRSLSAQFWLAPTSPPARAPQARAPPAIPG